MKDSLILLVSPDPVRFPAGNVVHLTDAAAARRAVGLYAFDRILVDPDLTGARELNAWLDARKTAESQPVLDEEALNRFLGGDRAMEAEVLPEFIRSSQEQLEALEKAHLACDWPTV